jgi:hypothetical protein
MDNPAPVNAASFKNVRLSIGHLTFSFTSDANMPSTQRKAKTMSAIHMLSGTVEIFRGNERSPDGETK